MIVYGEHEERVRTADLLRTIIAASDPVERMIRFGQLEAGIVDAACPAVDSITPLTAALREAALSGEYQLLARWQLPEEIVVRPAEGFSWYAVYPEMYSAAARRFVHEQRPAECVVIGIRSIGTTLSTAVEHELRAHGICAVSLTVRPRGHPFDRTLVLSEELERMLRAHAPDHFLIVDEGPGLSGSSFMSVAEALGRLGVPNNRIVLFPSHDPDPNGFLSERARMRWADYVRYFEPFDRDRYIPAAALDLSGGRWRDVIHCDVPVVPWHERRKYLDCEARVLWKWAGLGHYGRSRLERAEVLSRAGFIQQPRGIADGFLLSSWMEGEAASAVSDDLLDAMARYLAFIAASFKTEKRVPYESLIQMIRVNTGIECAASAPEIEDANVIAIDGRMLPHEWLRTSSGWRKADALDHHDDHFFPGCQDIAWDIAGAAIEFGFDAEALASRYLVLRPDPHLLKRLPFYSTAWLAYRIGYCTMAEESLVDSRDGLRFRRLRRRYTAALEPAATRPATSHA
jgi:hypothetical protein